VTARHSSATTNAPSASGPGLTTVHLAVLVGLSLVLLLLSFPPFTSADGFPVWMALVPMLVAARLADYRRLALVGWVLGFGYAVLAILWLRHVGPYAGVAAVLALGLYLSFYPPVFLVCWRLIDRRLRLPAVLSVPLVWVSLEYVRSFLLTGFPWFFLGHSLFRNLPLIQIADLFGAYGVSVLVAGVNGLGADLLWPALAPGDFRKLYRQAKTRLIASAAATGLALVATIIYGTVRLRQVTVVDGPRVALIQGNIPQSLKFEPLEDRTVYDIHAELSRQALASDPDLIIWPETMMPGFYYDGRFLTLDPDFDLEGEVRNLLAELNRPVLMGARTVTGDLANGDLRQFNSALLMQPDGRLVARYSKMHLVPFGEFVPKIVRAPVRLLPEGLNPIPYRFGLESGKTQTVFELPLDRAGQPDPFRFGVLICYEDTMPYLSRNLARRGVDALINITNDGWFRDSVELDQHVIGSVFRAVETRLPVVRAANTGISSIISPRGEEVVRLLDPDTGRDREVAGVLVQAVPLSDRRHRTLSVRWGDAPVQLWSVVALLLLLVSLDRELRERKTGKIRFF